MAADKGDTAHVEHSQHEAAIAGALALASLFSNCVEAFGLIHSSHKWEKEEQLLLSRLGIQQARLLIWGDIVGISSPPKSVTDRAVPKHPSAAYPDLAEPTFFGARDARLEEPHIRTGVEGALSAIVDRSSHATREEMMEKYGLKPPKRFASDYQPALDVTRLEGFREKYELLKEVAEDFANFNTRRSNSIVQTSWTIADYARFSSFIKLTQEKVDYLINLMNVKDGVDRGVRMDIKGLGWHLSADRQRVASDISKLRLIQEACKNEYPEYVSATQQALDNIGRERRENSNLAPPAPAPPKSPKSPLPKSTNNHEQDQTNGNHDKHKRPGIFGLFKFRKSHNNVPTTAKGRSQSVSSTLSTTDETPRSQSDAGPTTRPAATDIGHDDDTAPLEPIRSKSVGAILEQPAMSMDEEFIKNKLAQMQTNATVKEPLGGEGLDELSYMISRHDQYHGIARTETRDLRQS